jgi:23S rRNA pseudouridine1911/1915/1917 synthase
MSQRKRVKEATPLFEFVTEFLHGWTRTKVKQRLRLGRVLVNGVPVTQFDHALEPGDEVEVHPMGTKPRDGARTLKLLHNDNGLVAVNKPAGLLSVASAKEGEAHALGIVRAQISGPHRSATLLPVFRVDKDASGVLLFATSRDIRNEMAQTWATVKRTSLAIVEGIPDHESGTIEEPIGMDKAGFRALVGDHPDAKTALTDYKRLEAGERRALLELSLNAGRQHQVRAHLSWLGFPIVGDSRYGDGGGRMGLHAHKLEVRCPKTGAPLTFEAPIPRGFSVLLK